MSSNSRDAEHKVVLLLCIAILSGDMSLKPGYQLVGAQVEKHEHQQANLKEMEAVLTRHSVAMKSFLAAVSPSYGLSLTIYSRTVS